MADKISQSTNGDLSPNIIGDNNKLFIGINGDINQAREIKTMLSMVNLIPTVAKAKLPIEDIKFDYGTKDLHEKFDIRFNDFSHLLKSRITELSLLYRNTYEETKNISDVGEFDYEELLDRLRQLSIKALEEENNNPVEALKKLVSWFEDQFKLQSDLDYSIGSIEYFLYMELMNCNVFPNLVKN